MSCQTLRFMFKKLIFFPFSEVRKKRQTNYQLLLLSVGNQVIYLAVGY
jgi:hypothetical protein